MSRFSIYLLKQMSGPVLLITLMLAGMAWVTQAVRLLEVVAGQTDNALTYFKLTTLTMPRMLAYVLPISLFGGVLYSFNKLTQESELIVMSATGRSRWQLATPALILASIIGTLVLTINLWLSPMSLKILQDYQHNIQNDLAGTLVKESSFHNPANRLTIHSKSKAEDGTYRGLILHDARDQKNIISYIAREGALVRTDKASKFILIDGTIHAHNVDGPPNVVNFKEYVYDLSSIIQPKGSIRYPIKARYLSELLQPDISNEYNRHNKNKMIATGHYRIADFMLPFALVLICLATILTGTLNRHGQGKRLVVGASIALTFRLASFSTLVAVSNNLELLPLIYALPALTIVLALIWLLGGSDIYRFQQNLFFRKQKTLTKTGGFS